jgi:hypothetical protein
MIYLWTGPGYYDGKLPPGSRVDVNAEQLIRMGAFVRAGLQVIPLEAAASSPVAASKAYRTPQEDYCVEIGTELVRLGKEDPNIQPVTMRVTKGRKRK